MKSNLAELILMQGMLESSGNKESLKAIMRIEHTLPNGLTGKEWSKRKSRSKIARESRRRNRK